MGCFVAVSAGVGVTSATNYAELASVEAIREPGLSGALQMPSGGLGLVISGGLPGHSGRARARSEAALALGISALRVVV